MRLKYYFLSYRFSEMGLKRQIHYHIEDLSQDAGNAGLGVNLTLEAVDIEFKRYMN